MIFCDIANSTPTAARVGAEAMHKLLNLFFDLALAEVHRYGGTINQFLGDGFMALFGAPIEHEDHACRAVLAATAILQKMTNAEGEIQALRDVRLRMGLNTGRVLVGKIGDNLRMDYTAVGDTTNLAARLQSFAEPGTIRVSETTRRATEPHFTFRNLGKHTLKGVDARVAVFEPLAFKQVVKTNVLSMGRCPICADQRPISQTFCSQCGARLSRDVYPNTIENRAPSYTPSHLARDVLTSRFALEGEHKVVTVLFCDIANSTPLATSVGAEAMHKLLNRFFELALVEVHNYGGTINQFLGDGFMALFGAPIAHEDHAGRSVLAATAIMQRVENSDGEARALRDVRLRMGLNTGWAVVGKIGDNLRMDYTAVGDTTNLAARLQSFAEPGTICASETTRHAAEPHFTFRDLGKHTLKGIDARVAVFEPLTARTTKESSALGRRESIGSKLVGREREFAAVVQSLAALSDGRGEMVLLRGEPGVGKSRIVAEVRRREEATRILWLEGRAISFGRTLSYWPFIEILKSAFGIGESDAEAEAMRKLETGVRALFYTRGQEIVPYLASVMSLRLSEEHEQRVKFLDAQAMKRQVFLTMHLLFERLAERHPVLMVLEDWHWVDQSSVALCEHLLPLTVNIPISIWHVTRSEPRESVERLRRTAADIPGLRFKEIALAPLDQEPRRALIVNLFGGQNIPELALAQIEHRTAGNPFFIEEVVRALIADGTLVQDSNTAGWRLSTPVSELDIPDTVHGVIIARIDRLEDNVKSVLRFASVVGRTFFLRILRLIAESADNVEQGVSRLEEAELIRLRQQVPEIEYIFKHALVQEAAYGSILAERRRAIHRCVARAIEQLFAERRDEFVSLLAYHYARAEDWENAYAALLSAGDLAGRIAADAEALEHYRQAEAMFMKVASRELTPLQRATMDRKVGQAYYGIGDYEQAVSHFSRALAHLGVRYPRTHWGVLRGIASYLSAHFARTLAPRAALLSARRLDIESAREISTICQSLVWLDYFADEKRMTLDTLIELDAGERSGDALGLSRGLAGVGIILMLLGWQKLAYRYIHMANAIAQAGGAPAAVAASRFYGAWLALTTGSLTEADRTFEQATSAYASIGDLRGRCGAAAMRIWALLHRADFAHALALAEDVVRVGEDAGDRHVMSYGFNSLGVLRLTIGPLDEAERNLDRDRAVTQQVSSHRMYASAGGLLGKCYLRQGRLRKASQILLETMRFIEAKGMSDLFVADGMTGLAELRLVEADGLTGASRRAALRRSKKACAAAMRLSKEAAVAWRPEAVRLYGILAWLRGSRKQAIARWQESIAAAETMGMPVERARTLMEMGNRLGDIALINEAGAIFRSTGAKVDLAFALHHLARIGVASDTNAAGALALYDQAIAALDEVKAERRLSLAHQERAQLLARTGRRQEAGLS